MDGIEQSLCNAATDAITAAYYAFMKSKVDAAVGSIVQYGKGDTLGLDAMPEITIVKRLQDFDRRAVIITEETGSAIIKSSIHEPDPERFRTVFISDPTDRSTQMKAFLSNYAGRGKTVQEVIHMKTAPKIWEKEFGTPASITGCSSAITCIRRGTPIFSVMVNYLTEQLIVACSAGVFEMKLDEKKVFVDLDKIRKEGRPVHFRSIDPKDLEIAQRFVTFVGKSGYSENLRDSKLMDDDEIKRGLHYNIPGGPLRVLYLSNFQPQNRPIGFVLANGEKIGEWVHWLPYIRFARLDSDFSSPALELFEVFQDRPHTKEGILMSTSPAYSIFRTLEEGHRNKTIIDVSKFPDFVNPSYIRSTLIVAPRDNDWATSVVNQHGYRKIEF